MSDTNNTSVVTPKRVPNMAKTKTPIPELAVEQRIKSFDEIESGYNLEEAQNEAKRCLRCPKAPCNDGCPIGNLIPQFIQQIEEGDIVKAYKIIRTKSNLPNICSRICSQETQCEGKCTRGRNGEPVNIGALERFVCDWVADNEPELITEHFNESSADGSPVAEKEVEGSLSGVRIAIVGAGPAGLVVAEELALLGAKCTIFEKEGFAGGVMSYGIPKFRLPKSHIADILNRLDKLGVKFEYNNSVTNVSAIQNLVERYDKVVLANGADSPKRAYIDNENVEGVLKAKDLLKMVNLDAGIDVAKMLIEGNIVSVLGGGNVAMDAAQVALRLGAAKVQIVYRRSDAELPARRDEIEITKEEGVEFLLLKSPTSISVDISGKIIGVVVQEVELGEPDESGRRAPICKVGSET